MLFATYIQNLHNCIEPNTNRGEFTKKILKLIITNEKQVDNYSISSYNGFYDGKTQGKKESKKVIGDKICACAQKIVGYLDESEDIVNSLPKFKDYLKNLQFNTAAKNEICDSFRCELPDININNCIDKLSELLIRVIKEAAGNIKKENTLKKGTLSEEVLMEKWYSQLKPPSPSFSENELVKIEEIIMEMYIYLTEIDDLDLYQYIENKELFHSYNLSEDELIRRTKSCIPDDIYEKFMGHYNNLHKISSRLKYYNEMHMYSPLSDTVNTATSITLAHFLCGIPSSTQLALKNDLKFLSFAIRQLRE